MLLPHIAREALGEEPDFAREVCLKAAFTEAAADPDYVEALCHTLLAAIPDAESDSRVENAYYRLAGYGHDAAMESLSSYLILRKRYLEALDACLDHYEAHPTHKALSLIVRQAHFLPERTVQELRALKTWPEHEGRSPDRVKADIMSRDLPFVLATHYHNAGQGEIAEFYMESAARHGDADARQLLHEIRQDRPVLRM